MEEELDEEKVKTFAAFVIHEIGDNKVRTESCTVLDSRTTTAQKCEAVPRRARS